ncbi:hypothetical protein [Pelobium manganitolerans]|uniref:hypothetical protein n=1 Tax=Pelobium manganitolerans TaxID=1842495 RepID=UPI003FA34E7E
MKSIFFSALAAALALTACNQNKTANSGADSLATSNADTLKECYLATSGKDSAMLHINQLNGKVTGTLTYNFFEKDDADGDIKGSFSGDTLFVDFTFKAEGTVSKNPQAFLKKDGKLYQGYGNIESYMGRTYFKGHSQIKFDQGFVFDAIDCK